MGRSSWPTQRNWPALNDRRTAERPRSLHRAAVHAARRLRARLLRLGFALPGDRSLSRLFEEVTCSPASTGLVIHRRRYAARRARDRLRRARLGERIPAQTAVPTHRSPRGSTRSCSTSRTSRSPTAAASTCSSPPTRTSASDSCSSSGRHSRTRSNAHTSATNSRSSKADTPPPTKRRATAPP